jgi:hypothetical protein
MVGNQLGRQHREGSPPAAAHKARYRNALLLELRKKLNRIAPVGRDGPIATRPATDRAARPKEVEKIDPVGQKRFFVFPNRFKSVRKGKLNLSAPARKEAGVGPLKPLALPPCGSWLFYQDQSLTPQFRPVLYHRFFPTANFRLYHGAISLGITPGGHSPVNRYHPG